VVHAFVVDKMPVSVFDSIDAMGAAAARDLAAILRESVAKSGYASIIVATANSQLSFYAALRALPDIPWDRITVFHMDEYLGLSDQHPASFRQRLRENLIDVVRPRAFHALAGDAANPEEEIRRYAALLRQQPPVACVLGIGENGHLAFNDPPADFETHEDLAVVVLDELSRRQQVGEGHFSHTDEVPRSAITLTIPALLRASYVLAVVPEVRKAVAVQCALERPVSQVCPASILRTQSHVRLYLDLESASLLADAVPHFR
jgi:glucosamine-6-phosphate deaminase